MRTSSTSAPSRSAVLGLLVITILCVIAYFPGLNGPFLFDDNSHISKNIQVQIIDLGIDSLTRAWHSSGIVNLTKFRPKTGTKVAHSNTPSRVLPQTVERERP